MELNQLRGQEKNVVPQCYLPSFVSGHGENTICYFMCRILP